MTYRRLEPAETYDIARKPPPTGETARLMALGAVAGPILFTVAWLVLGFLSAAFVLSGVLMAVGVVGTFHRIPELGTAARWCCIVLLGLVPLGSVMDGIFTLESFLPHFVGAGLGFGSPVLSFLITGLLLYRIPPWRRFANWLIVGSPLTLALVVLYFATFSPTAEGAKTGVAGLTERILIIEVLAWFVALGWL